MRVALAAGLKPEDYHASWSIHANDSPQIVQAMFRNGKQPLMKESSERDIFEALLKSDDPLIWKVACDELSAFRHPDSGSTFLHLTCLKGDIRIFYENIGLVKNF